MKIDRHNYEEYFLLYADNELPKADRQLVEAFVMANPDLQDEFDLFLSLKIVPDKRIRWDEKEFLYRKSASEINSANYESYLLDYIDNELNETGVSELETFLSENPIAKQELEILFKTKPGPDTSVQYPDKTLLLSDKINRRTGSRIIGSAWWRVAAAAVILLALSIVAINSFNTKTPEEQVAAGPVINDQSNKKQAEKIIVPETHSASGQLTVSETKKDNDATATKIKNKKTTDDLSQKQQNIKVVSRKETIAFQDTDQPEIKMQLPVNPAIGGVNNYSQINTPIAVIDRKVSQQIINNPAVTSSLKDTYYPQNAVRDEVFINAIADENTNRRFRGILRKATRFFERTTNISVTDDEDRLLVGGIAFDLK